MLFGRLVGVMVLAGSSAACTFSASGFQCSTDDQCGGGGGRCEVNSFCSFPDSNCDSGRSYDSRSGALANKCVGDVPDAGVDAPVSLTDATDVPLRPFCDAANEPALVGCWQFEDDLTDASGDSNDGTGTNISFSANGMVAMAAQLAANSAIAVPDSSSLSPASVTIEGWINLTSIPTNRYGVFDNDGSYGLFVTATGLQCINVSAPVTLIPGQWTHVACTYDGTGRLYVGGVEVGMMAGGGALGTGNSNGSAIGGNSPSGNSLEGMIDQLRVWNVARTPSQICNAAGVLLCP